MVDKEQLKKFAKGWIDDNMEWLSNTHEEIWSYHEPAWREYKSSDLFCDLLSENGFQVEQASGNMPTAFVATYDNGGPMLATFAEYDAVPGNSQKPVPYQEARDEYSPYAAGHTDPHSALGIAALTGVLATKETIDEHNLAGSVRIYGEPAEKVCGSKPIHATKGYYDENDAHIAYHPRPTNTVLGETQSGSYWSIVFTFEADEPEKWSNPDLIPQGGRKHAEARSPGAIDAVTLMYNTTKYTKESMFPHTGTWTLNEYIMTGGQSTADNAAPRISRIQYSWRSPTLEIQDRIYNILKNNAKNVAKTTDCTLEEKWISKTRFGLANSTMTGLVYDNLREVGPPEFNEEAVEFGRQIQSNLDIEVQDDPFKEEAQSIMDPEVYNKKLRRNLPDWQENFSSDDYVEYTWHAPTARLYTATGKYLLSKPNSGYSYPDWSKHALGGVPHIVNPGMFVAGKTIATSFLDLILDPDTLENAEDEFKRKTGGGIGGDQWVEPLLPEDFEPPINLPWPEYVDTRRGKQWSE